MSRPSGSAIPGGIVVLVVAAIVGGLMTTGTPSDQRARRMDDRRVKDLQQIAMSIDRHYQTHQHLPESLAELSEDATCCAVHKDPASGDDYTYQPAAEPSSGTRFTVCATFERQLTVPITTF